MAADACMHAHTTKEENLGAQRPHSLAHANGNASHLGEGCKLMTLNRTRVMDKVWVALGSLVQSFLCIPVLPIVKSFLRSLSQ